MCKGVKLDRRRLTGLDGLDQRNHDKLDQRKSALVETLTRQLALGNGSGTSSF
jgi:hypothetical protein